MNQICSILFLIHLIHFCHGQSGLVVNTQQPTRTCETTTSVRYSRQTSLCSTTLILNSDSTFTMEYGCEGQSKINIGHWRISEDSVELMPLPSQHFNLICDISAFGERNSMLTAFIFVDKTGHPIQNLLICPKRLDKTYTVTTNPRVILDEKGAKAKIYSTDENGYAYVNVAGYDKIEFPQLKIFEKTANSVERDFLTDSVRVTLDINAEALYYSSIEYYQLPTFMRFKAKNGTLAGKDIVMTRQD